MKRRDGEKDRFCGNPSQVDPIPLDLKLTRLPTKFLLKTHQNKLLCQVESTILFLKLRERDGIDNEERSPSKVDSLPLDLEVEIMTRLPGKSLIKFRCVSKIWSSIIRSQRFIDSFFAMSSTMRSNRFIIVFSNGVFAKGDARRLFIFSSSYEGEESSSLVANFETTVPSVTFPHGSKCASIHGFVSCLTSGKFVVCNPCTGQVDILPCSARPRSFGYDPVDNQFKALILLTPPYQDRPFLVHEVLTRGESSWRSNKFTSPPYFPVTAGLCINGFVYSGAWTPRQRMDPVIVCFDVRYESLSFITAPRDVVCFESYSIFIEYNGKLASIVRSSDVTFRSFDLWILEDVDKHDWSKQTFELPFPLVDVTSPGTNKAGEIIFAPYSLPQDVEPFYIFYYNLERKDMRRVRLQGLADTQEFRRKYGLIDCCCVSILSQHVESIASF